MALAALSVFVTSGQVIAAFCPHSAFQDMSLQELRTLQGKITWLGAQFNAAYSIGFTAAENPNAFAIAEFTPYRRPGFFYLNDDAQAIDVLAVPVASISAFLDSVATLPNVTDGNVDPGGALSFMLFNNAGVSGPCGFEAILDQVNGAALFLKLRRVFGADASVLKSLNRWGCERDLLPANTATDVTTSVTVTMGGVRLKRGTDNLETNTVFVAKARVKNVSSGSLSGPLSLVPNPSGQVELDSPDGYTCRLSPMGLGYVHLPVGSGLGPGQTAEVILRFTNPALEEIHVTPKVYSGSGER
jgi:hypothetical protein